MKLILKCILSVFLILGLCLTYVFAADMDEDELPGIVFDPTVPVLTRVVIVFAPESWSELYVCSGAAEQFPGSIVLKKGNLFILEVTQEQDILTFSTPDPEGGYLKTAGILLLDNGKDVAVVVGADGSYQIAYGTLGDVTGDGKLNIGDAARIYAHLRGSVILPDTAQMFADYTGDGKLNMGDVAKIYAQVRATVPVI